MTTPVPRQGTGSDALRRVDVDQRSYGASIAKVARHPFWVESGCRVLEVADALQAVSDVRVVAVLDESRRPIGTVCRDELFAMLGKPFGRDVLSRSAIADLAVPLRCFDRNANLFTVIEAIEPATGRKDNTIEANEVRYFGLLDAEGLHAGLFSLDDLRLRLSRMTQEDITMAARLQERMIGHEVHHSGANWEFRAWCQPAKGVGGDFHAARDIGGGRWFFALCDVSGKGVAASILSSMVWGMLGMYDFRHGLKNLVLKLNEAVLSTFQLERYLTGVFMVFDTEKKALYWCDMGHSHIVMRSCGGAVRALAGSKPNMPVGLEPHPEVNVWKTYLSPGDLVMAYTDGVTEQENTEHEEFGEHRLTTLLAAAGPGTAAADSLPQKLEAWRGPIPQQDDMSFICLELG